MLKEAFGSTLFHNQLATLTDDTTGEFARPLIGWRYATEEGGTPARVGSGTRAHEG